MPMFFAFHTCFFLWRGLTSGSEMHPFRIWLVASSSALCGAFARFLVCLRLSLCFLMQVLCRSAYLCWVVWRWIEIRFVFGVSGSGAINIEPELLWCCIVRLKLAGCGIFARTDKCKVHSSLCAFTENNHWCALKLKE